MPNHDDEGCGRADPRPGPVLSTKAQLRLTAMSMMASTMAHDLIEPLATAVNYLGASVRGLADCECAEASIANIEHGIEQITKTIEIIRRMRSFALEGKVRGTQESLRVMIERVHADLAVHDRFDAEFIILIGADANFVLVDRIQIELVLTNLLVNAVEAVQGRKLRRIEVRTWRAGDEVELRISDSGPGLAKDSFAELFDPLFSTKPGGSGLGLPICRAIVEAHGGRLWAEAPSEFGASFGVTLPAADRP